MQKASGTISGQARQARFAGKDFHKIIYVTGKQNAPENPQKSLLAGTVAAIPNLIRAGFARNNAFQKPYLSGKPAIDRRLAFEYTS